MKVFFIFLFVFSVVMIINQLGYGSCFSSYCMTAAIPKVSVISTVITGIIYWMVLNEKD